MQIDNQIASRHWRSRRAIPTTFRAAPLTLWQDTAALRDFGPSYDGLGLKARITAPQRPLRPNEQISAAMNRGSRSCHERTHALQQKRRHGPFRRLAKLM
jgi:hypothetical protein